MLTTETPTPAESEVLNGSSKHYNGLRKFVSGGSDALTALDDLKALESAKRFRTPASRRMIANLVREQPELRTAWYDELKTAVSSNDKELIAEQLKLANLLGLDDPNLYKPTSRLIKKIAQTYGIRLRQVKKEKRPPSLQRVAGTAVAAVGLLGVVGVSSGMVTEAVRHSQAQTVKFDRSKIFNTPTQPDLAPTAGSIAPEPAQPAAQPAERLTPKPTPTSSPEPIPTPEKQVQTFLELIKPMVEEAQKRRQAEASKDPEYFHKVDKELNSSLLNIALMGYGEEHGESYQQMGGSFTIMSINLKTGEIGTVSLSRDIRVPELEDQAQGPGRQWEVMRHLYRIKGFDGTREVLQKATGLAVDYQIVIKDVFIRDYLNEVAGSVTLNVPKDHHTGPYRLGGQDFGPDYIPAGEQTMDTQKAMTFILGEDQNPEGRQDERSYRKNLLMKALLKQLKNEIHNKNPIFGLKLTKFVLGQLSRSDVTADFDLGLMGEMAKKGMTAGVSIPEISDQRQVVFHDKFFGDGGVRRVHNIANHPNEGDRTDSENITEEVAGQKLPEWMLIPEGGDPYAPDTVDGYYAAMRQMVKALWGMSSAQQSEFVAQPATLPPTPTSSPTTAPTTRPTTAATLSPTPRIITPTTVPTRTPTPSPEPTKTAEQIIGDRNLAEYFLGDLTTAFVERRLERAEADPAFAERVSAENRQKKVMNFLVLGVDETREREKEFSGQGLGRSDVMMFVSLEPQTLKTVAVSFPRDLYSPLSSAKLGVSRINGLTMAPVIRASVDPFEAARQEIETATGEAVDGVVKFNIDAMQGYPNHPGVLQRLFPQGLRVVVPQTLVDNEYPVGYGTTRVVFPAGEQVMGGVEATRYARLRHADSDFGRSDRQRQILRATAKEGLIDTALDFAKGDVYFLDEIIATLEDEQAQADMFSDLNFTEILGTMRDNLTRMRNPQGLAMLAVLAANTRETAVNFEDSFVSFGLGESGLIGRAGRAADPYLLSVAGSSLSSPPTSLGNYMGYWAPVRARLAEVLE